jgi:hypothetical protein
MAHRKTNFGQHGVKIILIIWPFVGGHEKDRGMDIANCICCSFSG